MHKKNNVYNILLFILSLLFIQQNYKLIFFCLNKVHAFKKLYTIYIEFKLKYMHEKTVKYFK